MECWVMLGTTTASSPPPPPGMSGMVPARSRQPTGCLPARCAQRMVAQATPQSLLSHLSKSATAPVSLFSWVSPPPCTGSKVWGMVWTRREGREGKSQTAHVHQQPKCQMSQGMEMVGVVENVGEKGKSSVGTTCLSSKVQTKRGRHKVNQNQRPPVVGWGKPV